ncbi:MULTISPECIES: Bug family tripartite tricarboxylate transporter substrate binding protein [Achromobacter]|jgi:tripartite-type tricarboxylate transporter receptor subunit TctC|uniref:Argininosuccinate lyase n=1 Tax=Achromobacter aegrifaciens TaxID=1287736 RepID=A0AAD2J469_ACHAE|nr:MULTISPECIES: tripartite tricarboxylate transporter substrate binding protein [Achromobacter]MBD9422279.1 tripartite tricarboxylate transporter substrate binding protein [Achromobacter sp. ACM04]MBD9432381.1 tripartite tricarboxylate transporter substrate binding protein [Achromobacter sp. ACM03]MBD9475450.1 tripartite tricarboxylate transporter substrate binding protein [Achromobacter sp. ACM01]MDQ1759446.1 tripartite tricarboxylate transporter substrate binding protein [Achromobacter aegri
MHKHAKRLLALAALSLAAGAASAQSWPTQPIRWIVPYPAGGGTDVVARTVASGLEKPLGQTIVVENRPGAATIIGATAIAQAEANGYMVGTADSGTLAFNPSLYAKLSYDPSKFTYIGGIAKFPLLLAVNVNSPFKTVDDVIQAAKKEPGKLSAASAGAGSPHHLALELFKQRTNANVLHVPYKGAAPAVQDLLGGQVDLMFIDLASGLPNVKAGKLRVLAAATPERVAALPDVPTMAEQGVPNFTAYAWQGLVGPAGLPEPVVKKLAADLEATLKSPAVSQKILDMGVIPMPMSSQEFKAYAEQERSAWADVIKKAGIKLE